MSGMSAGKGSRISGGTAGDATSGGNTNVSIGGFGGNQGFNVPRSRKNDKFYIGGVFILGLVFLLKRKK